MKKLDKIVIICIVLYAGIMSLLALARYYNFSLFIGDHATISQAIWSTLHGKFMMTTTGSFWYSTDQSVNFLAFHIAPIYLLVMPLFLLIPVSAGLIAFKCILMAGAGYMLYKLSKEIIDPVKSALLTLLFLVTPNVIGSIHDSFHGDYFAPIVLFTTMYFFVKDRFLQFIIFAFLFLTIKESFAPTIFAIGFYALVVGKSKKWVILPMVISLGYVVFTLGYLYPILHQNAVPIESCDWKAMFFANLNPIVLIKTVFNRHTLVKDILFFFSSGRFLTFFDLSFIIWLPEMLLKKVLRFPNGGHYGLLLNAGIFLTLPQAIKRVEKCLNILHAKTNIILSLFFIVAVLTSYNSLRVLNPKNFIPNAHITVQREVLSLIPENASVSCSDLYLAHLVERDKLDWLGHDGHKREYEYVLLDLNQENNEHIEWDIVEKYWKQHLETSDNYKCIFSEDNIKLYRKGDK